MLDYITYTWVKDDEVAFNEELIQVKNDHVKKRIKDFKCCKDVNKQLIPRKNRYISAKRKSQCEVEIVCCATSAAI